jgi:ABC-2 type transport system ATP-binding protein
MMGLPTVQVTGIEKRFRRTVALAGVTLEARTGITGLLGPNGAGKTTLLRMMATVLAPDSGSLRLLGCDPAKAEGRLSIRRRLGYMPQEPGFHRNFTAFEFVDYVAILKEMTDRRPRHDEVRRVLALVGLESVMDRKIRALSGGMRRRVALAQSLLGDPDLLVLDEPTAGLDPEQRLRFRELISGRAQDRTVILSTHQTEDVVALSPRVIVLHEGRELFDGTPSDLAELARGRSGSPTSESRGVPVLADRRGQVPQRGAGPGSCGADRAHDRGRVPAHGGPAARRGGGVVGPARALDPARRDRLPARLRVLQAPEAGLGPGLA